MHFGHRSRQSSIVAGVIFVGAGLAHFARPDFFESIVPDWFPNATLANRASGAAEFTFGLGNAPSPHAQAVRATAHRTHHPGPRHARATFSLTS